LIFYFIYLFIYIYVGVKGITTFKSLYFKDKVITLHETGSFHQISKLQDCSVDLIFMSVLLDFPIPEWRSSSLQQPSVNMEQEEFMYYGEQNGIWFRYFHFQLCEFGSVFAQLIIFSVSFSQ